MNRTMMQPWRRFEIWWDNTRDLSSFARKIRCEGGGVI